MSHPFNTNKPLEFEVTAESTPQDVLNALLRSDFPSFCRKAFEEINPGVTFIDNWHIEAMEKYAKDCANGVIKNGIVSVPPRSMKTEVFSIFLPAFLLGKDPSKRIICASYSQELADELAVKCKKIMESSWYQEIFPNTRLSTSKSGASNFLTTEMGGRYATSIGGTITGKGGNLLIVDDPIKADDAFSAPIRNKVNHWLSNTLPSRLNNPNEGSIVVVQQRLHENDPVGYLLEQGGWNHLSIPAIAQENMEIQLFNGQSYLFKEGEVMNPKLLGKEVLDSLKNSLGSDRFSAQYLQLPVSETGNLINPNDFRTYTGTLKKEVGDHVIICWDLAITNKDYSDYTAGTVWLIRNNQYYLIHVIREKVEYPQLPPLIANNGSIYDADLTIIEDSHIGKILEADLRKIPRFNIKRVPAIGSKRERMTPGTLDIRAGHVWLPNEAGWLAEFKRECAAFPYGKHDDQVDSLAHFLTYMRESYHHTIEQSVLKETINQMTFGANLPDELKTKDDVSLHLWGRKPSKSN